MINTSKCKICRRAREKLFLKEEKCYTPKCPLTRKSYAPGMASRSAKKPKRGLSEYGFQLAEKQKLKFFYLLKERQFRNYVKEALRAKGRDIPERLAELLESRLDSAVFRLGFAKSRSGARQMASHGHFLVNNRRVTIPSYRMKIGDKISIRPQSISKGKFQNLDIQLKKYEPPAWLKLNKSKYEGEVIGRPQLKDIEFKANTNSIIEFYSR
jgi:small subunit ribosomal protein S4